MSQAEFIIEKFGGVRPMASALGAPPTTIQGWKERGFIPARRQSAVLAAARARGIELGPADFFAADAAGLSPGAAAAPSGIGEG